jgi:hypothetical protein
MTLGAAMALSGQVVAVRRGRSIKKGRREHLQKNFILYLLKAAMSETLPMRRHVFAWQLCDHIRNKNYNEKINSL